MFAWLFDVPLGLEGEVADGETADGEPWGVSSPP